MKSRPSALIAAQHEVQRASYVAWLLRIEPFKIFPFTPECTPEANQHLIDSVLEELNKHREQASKSCDTSSRAVWFRHTIGYCEAVMSGVENPADNGWYENQRGYRRGVYLFKEGVE